MKRRNIVLSVMGVAVVGLLASTPPALDYVPPIDADPALGPLIADSGPGLIPGTEKRLLWHAEEVPTEWSVVALHGFSATRQETAPLAEVIANSLGANLFETRFAGHGLQQNALVNVTAEEWLDDAAEALTVGKLIGKKVVIVAMSTGATIALALLDHPTMQSVDAMILLSPNFAPADPNAMWITKPAGPPLLRLFYGPTRSWEAENELQARYWTTSYPTRTIVEVIRVVDRAREKILSSATPRVQMIYSPDDKVISTAELRSAFEIVRSPQKELYEVPDTFSPSAHVIVGDIIAPDNTAPIAEKASDFILRRAQQDSPQ